VSERRPKNSELHLRRLEEEEQEEREQDDQRGILEIFDDSDEPLARDEDR
jgi:hypothetical protein